MSASPTPVDSIEIILRILSYLKSENRTPKKKLDILTHCRLTDDQFDKYMFKGVGNYVALKDLYMVMVLPPPQGDKRIKALFTITDKGLRCLDNVLTALLEFFNPKKVESRVQIPA